MHFASKDDLVANVVADQMSAQVAAIRALPAGRAGLEQFIRGYLTPEHRDHPSLGCPSAALLDEIARGSDAVKHAYTESVAAIIAEFAERLEAPNSEAARANAIGLYTMLVGTLQLARAVDDDALSREVLECGIKNAEAYLTQRASAS